MLTVKIIFFFISATIEKNFCNITQYLHTGIKRHPQDSERGNNNVEEEWKLHKLNDLLFCWQDNLIVSY